MTKDRCQLDLAPLRRPARHAIPLVGCLAGCLLFCGCGALGPVGAPLGLGGGKSALSKAVEKDPFPDAASVNLQI